MDKPTPRVRAAPGAQRVISPGAVGPAVLYVEDDHVLRQRVTTYLESHGMSVVQVHTLTHARTLLASHYFDVLLLDLNLGREDGLVLAREVGARGAPAVIITSSRIEEADRIMGLELGADDYLTKPYPFRELLARIRAVTRRTRAAGSLGRTGIAHFGRWRFDESSRRLIDDDGKEIRLTAGETALLRVFLHHPHRVLARHELLGKSRGEDASVFERTVDVLVARVRRKLETGGGDRPVIDTVRGAGYRLAYDVQWDRDHQ